VAWRRTPAQATTGASREDARHLRVALARALPRVLASQAGVLSPILSAAADDSEVSIAAAGELRILAAPLAVVAALAAWA
jgi:hypothetical protein